MMIYYKATRQDGTDFHTGTVRWLPGDGPPTNTYVVRHPTSSGAVAGDHSTSLAVSTDPTVLPGARWPMRLAEVEPADAPVVQPDETKRQSVAWRVVREIPAHTRFGPQGVHVAVVLAETSTVYGAHSAETWCAARDDAWVAAMVAAWDAAMDAARDAARHVAMVAAWDAGREAAWDAVMALVVRDLISREHYEKLTATWRDAGGTIPDHADTP